MMLLEFMLTKRIQYPCCQNIHIRYKEPWNLLHFRLILTTLDHFIPLCSLLTIWTTFSHYWPLWWQMSTIDHCDHIVFLSLKGTFFWSGKLPGKSFGSWRTEGTHAPGAEGTLYEEGGLSGKTPAEGAGGVKETTGAARTGGGIASSWQTFFLWEQQEPAKDWVWKGMW